MLRVKASVTSVLMFCISGAAAFGCHAQQENQARKEQLSDKKVEASTPEPEAGKTASGELKILREGFYGSVENAFIYVARHIETYAELRKLVDGLPDKNEEFFKANAVVAAFLGTRPSGGYSISIVMTPGGSVRVSEVTPPKDAMSAAVLTNPFKIVSISVDSLQPIDLGLDDAWKKEIHRYRVRAGSTFKMSGGFAGRVERFQLEGEIDVLRHEKLVTLLLNLRSAGGTKARTLQDIASGIVQKDGQASLEYLTTGTLVDMPHPALRAEGTFSDSDSKLSLAFTSQSTLVSDGYEGEGNLDALLVGKSSDK